MLRNLFLIVPFLLLVHVTSAVALSPCPSDDDAYWDNCEGTYTYADGEKYVGEWRDDKRHGHGTYTRANGDKYVGEFRDDKAHGYGTYTWGSGPNNGEKYVGEYRNSEKHGYGTYTWADGDKYVGEFRDGQANGQHWQRAAFQANGHALNDIRGRASFAGFGDTRNRGR